MSDFYVDGAQSKQKTPQTSMLCFDVNFRIGFFFGPNFAIKQEVADCQVFIIFLCAFRFYFDNSDLLFVTYLYVKYDNHLSNIAYII